MLLPLAVISLAFQLAGATISGVVRDEVTGTPIGSAVITMTDIGRETTTDAFGSYHLSGVPAGPHHLAVRHLGYLSPQLGVFVPLNGDLTINLVLRPSPLSIRAVTLHAYVPIRGAEEDTRVEAREQTRASGDAIRDNPLVSEADVLETLAGADVSLGPEAPAGLHVRGGSADQVAYLLDDVPIFNPYHSGAMFSAWNPDAIGTVELHAPSSGIEAPNVLGGTVSVKTIDNAPGTIQLGLSTTQARGTVDGMVRGNRLRYIVSARSALSGFRQIVQDRRLSSLLAVDAMAVLKWQAFGGTMSILHYNNANAISAPMVAQSANDTLVSGGESERNDFGWTSHSTGAGWKYRSLTGLSVRALLWDAATSARSDWRLDSAVKQLIADRRDRGGFVALKGSRGNKQTSVGMRLNFGRTRYESRSDQSHAAGAVYGLMGKAATATIMMRDAGPVTRHVSYDMSLRAILSNGRAYWAPQVMLQWSPDTRVAVQAEMSRTFQFEQSLRNPESAPSFIFPAELYVNHGSPGVTVGRTTQFNAATTFRPLPGIRIALTAYDHLSTGLVLSAPVAMGPFASEGFVIGSASSAGGAIDLAISRTRYGLQASYGAQGTHVSFGDTVYRPGFVSSHQLHVGGLIHPAAGWTVRVATIALLGRSTTLLSGRFDWQSCTAPIGGCSLAGSPSGRAGPLGTVPLPPYFRLDVGIRRNWHLIARGRDAKVGAFAQLSNVLGRANASFISLDAATGARELVQMHPRAPFTAGLDLQF